MAYCNERTESIKSAEFVSEGRILVLKSLLSSIIPNFNQTVKSNQSENILCYESDKPARYTYLHEKYVDTSSSYVFETWKLALIFTAQFGYVT